MKTIKRHSIKLYLALAVAGLATLYLWPSLVAATPLTAQHRLERAWKLATDIGVYQHRSEVMQTSHPTPRLENSGRSPKVERLITSGFMNLPEDEMHLTLENLGGNHQAVEMKVEGGKSYGRQPGSEEWVELDAAADIFAAGGDPLGFLIAMENIQEVSGSSSDVALDTPYSLSEAALPTSYSRFTFDINGPRYAKYMATQMEAELQRRGKLPAGMHLGMADQYLNMKARGEIWLNDEGLPARQVLHLEFPPERNAYEWHEADITTTFQGWDTGTVQHQLFWVIPRITENPSILLNDPRSLLPRMQPLDPETMQIMGIMLGLSLLLAALAVFVFAHRHSQKIYAAFSLAVIVSMLVTPLLQSNHVLAFSQRQHSRIAAQESEQAVQRAVETNQAKMVESNFDPTINPLAEVSPPPNPLPLGGGTIASPPERGNEGGLSLPQLQTTCANPVAGDTDCDGNPDNDGDGLTDQVEVVKLGTDPNDIDTDGDRISDRVEVEGFIFNNQQWYLDPNNPDSNNDGVQDFLECINLVDITAEGTWPVTQLGTACENTDGDTTPDVFDFDNDGDGVPDTLDLALNFVGGVSSSPQSNLLLDLSNFTTDKTTLVDFQIRPANPDHLWQNNNVFDWPDNDVSGQINRVSANTFADVSNSDNPVPQLSQGDVMLTPMLQIKIANPISNTTNPAGSLPVDAAFSGDITTTPITGWLDIDMLNDYAISVNADAADGSLVAYVPLAQVTDPVGDTPVAWQARMAYRPEMAAWGQAHEVKLLWTVLALTDSCDISGLSTPDDPDAKAAWCANYDHWVTEQSIIQTYYEDFTLTGMSVTEDHGSKTAVVAQTDALSVSYESHLWQLVRGLQSTFLVGDQISAGTRFTIEEIKNRFDKNTTPYTTGNAELWDIPNDKIIVQNNSAVDATTAFRDLQTSVPALLNAAYSGATTGDVVTLLFAREDSTRSAILEDTDLVTINNNAISVDLSEALLGTHASLNWKPYQRGSAKWNAYAIVDYLLNNFEPALAGLSANDLQAMMADETINNEQAAREGAIFLAQNYYLTFYQGLADLVEIEGQIVGEDIINNADFALAGEGPITLIIADMLNLMATVIEDDQAVYASGNLVAKSNFESLQLRSFLLESASFGEARLGIIISEAAGILAGRGMEWVTKKVYKKFNNFAKTTPKYGKYAKKVGTGLSILSVGAGVSGEYFFKDEDVKRAMLLTAASATVGSEVLSTYGAFTKVSLLKQLKGLSPNAIWAKSGARVWDQMLAVKSVVKTGAIVGLAVETVTAIAFLAVNLALDGIQLGSIQANLLLSETIGQVVVAIITTALSLTGVGVFVVGLFAIIDALTSLICELARVDPESAVRQWVCAGFSGAVAQGVSYLIYDYFTPYNVNNKDRLAITYDMGQPINNTGVEGFVAGNSIQIGANISNTITLAEPERVIIKTSYLKPGTLKLDTERLLDIGKTSTFSYTLTTNPPAQDAANNLSLNGTTWQGNTSFFSPTDEFIFTEGVNVLPQIYLSEQYSLATIECWGFVGADEQATCDETKELKGANNTPVGGLFVFDVLPNTVDRLPGFFRTQYRQPDADGDGLLSYGSGLTDPDDTTWDTDNDGLSDFWEMNNAGFDPEDPDSDNDGLFDYWEAFYRTNPLLPDSDSDGLPDGDEFYHSNARSAYVDDSSTWSGGWTVVYDYNGSQRLQLLVSADPLDSDTDADTILDNLERAYGYHPDLPSIINILTLDSQPDALAYLPGSTINYTATVKNELDNRVAYGLLETEFPVDVVQQQQIINALYPQVETNLSGSLTAPNTNQSLTQDLVVRAGALIGTTAVDEVFVLPFTEAGSTTTFLDATSARHDFTCTACPTANNGFATFNGSQTLTRPHNGDFDASPFSLSAWVRPTAHGGVIYNDLNDFTVEQLIDGTIQATFDGTALASTAALALNKWNYVVVAYLAGEATIFVNSIESASGSVGAITRNNSNVEIGSGFTGDIDRIALHTSALTKEDILDVFNGLTMYASFDDGVAQSGGYCGFTDAISQRGFECGPRATRDERRWDGAVPDGNGGYFNLYDNKLTTDPRPDTFAGVAGDSVSLAYNSNPTFRADDLNSVDHYLHFNHPLSLAGTTPGKNDNAFSIALWIHAANPYLSAYWIPKPDQQPDYNNAKGTILTLPDQPGVDSNLPNSTNPMVYTAGDGGQVRVEALPNRGLKVDVAGCTATLDEFMFKGQTNVFNQFNNTFSVTPANYWQHLVIAFNGQNKLNLYQNGKLSASVDCVTTTDFKTVNGFTLGYSSLTNDRLQSSDSFWGYVDELRFYNRGFTVDEARELYLNTSIKFNFNGRTGQTFFTNESPSGIFGTCSGATCPESGLPSLDNQAVRFDGNDYVELSANAAAVGLKDGSFTIAGWVKGTGSLLGVPSESNNWLFAGVSGNKPKIYWTGATGAEAATALNPNQWNHLAFRYQENKIDGTFLGEIKIYVNGELAATTTNNLPFAGNGIPRIGHSLGGNFTGMLDNVVVAGYPLTPGEIQTYVHQVPLLNYHLDEGLENVLQTFTNFSDDGVLGLTATCSGDACPSAGSRGQMREALVFDGDDMLTIPHNAALIEDVDLDNLHSFSVGMWVKPQQQKNSQQTLAVKGDNSNQDQKFGLFIKPNSMKVQYSATGFCGSSEEVLAVGESVGSLNEDQWNHVMMVSQFTPNGWFLKLYLNGAFQGETFTYIPCRSLEPIRIGDSPGADGFEGSIDEFTFHNIPLNAEEIKAMYDYQVSWYDTTVHTQITIDAAAPQVDLGDSPTFLNSETRLLSLSAYDIDSGIASVSVKITDPQGGQTTQEAASSGEPNSAAWFYTFAPNQAGRYTIRATATDRLGHTKTAIKYIDVDTAAPGPSLTSNSYNGSTEKLTLTGSVNDPGSPTSGVATATMTVDVHDRNGTSISGPIAANVALNGNWTVAYPFPAIPYGEFTSAGVVADAVGNSYQGAVTNGNFSFDAIGPIADVVIDTDILGGLTSGIQGTASDIGYNLTGQQTVFHFEETSGATEFIDGSPGQVVATCAAPGCPTAGQGGKLGIAARFDGVDDRLDMGSTPAISGTQAFAVSAWVKTSAKSEQVIIQQRSITATDGLYRLSLAADGTVNWRMEGEGATAFDLSSGGAVNNNQWHHILAQREADGTGRIYIDGLPDGVVTATARAILASGVTVGADGIAGDKFFNGSLDEVTIFTGVPAADEVYYMANPLISTVTAVQVRFRSFAERDISPDQGTWHPVDSLAPYSQFATWSLALPTLSPGNYKIDLKASDSHGNTRFIGDVWSGGVLDYDLLISAAADVSLVTPGDQITYTVTYTNSSGSSTSVPGAELALTVPVNMSFNPGLNPGWSCVPDTNTGSLCTYPAGELIPGESGVMTATLDVLNQISAGAPAVSTTLTIGPLTGDQLPANNAITVTTPLSGTWPELAVIKSTQGITPTPGSQLPYVITVTNSGNLGAIVVLTETVPNNGQTGIVIGPPWDCESFGGPGEDCVLNIGEVPAGGVVTTTFTLRLDQFIPDGTVLTNTIRVGDANHQTETDLTDNIFQLVTPVDTSGTVNLFGVVYDQVTVQEGQVATNTINTPCDPDPPELCEIGANASIGEFVTKIDEFGTPYLSREWELTNPDGPDNTGNVAITFFSPNGNASANFMLTVENITPTIAITGADSIPVGSPYTVTLGSVIDPGPDTVTACTVNWADGNSDDCLSAIGGGSLDHTYTTSAVSRTITVDLTDEDGLHLMAGSKVISFTENTAPVFAAIGPQTIAETETLTFTAVATDADGDTVTYSLASGPLGATIDANSGLFSWATTETDGANSYPATIIASAGGLSTTLTTLITVIEVNAAPVFAAVSDPTIDEGATLNLSVTATDSDIPEQILTYSLGGGPMGAAINPDSGLFSWTVDAEVNGAGPYPAFIRVSDGVVTESKTILITINEVNKAPVLDPLKTQTVTAGETVTFTATASDSDLPAQTLSYSLGDAPAGATINPGSGLFSWVSSAAGLYIAAVIVSDGTLTDTQNVAIIVEPGSVAPQFFPFANKTIQEGQTALYFINAYDANGDTLTYSLSDAPAGAVISSTTGLFSWTTTEADGPGVYTATVNSSDGVFTTSQVITITVTEQNLPPILDPIADQSVSIGGTISFTAIATDTDIPAQTLTFSLINGPAGAGINSGTGLFSWDAGGAGVYTTTIAVSDGSLTASQVVSITVTSPNSPPVLDPIGPQTVAEGETVSFTAVATDTGVPTQTLTFSLSDAPIGANIGSSSGTFSWATTEADGPGVYSATVVVSDGALTDSQTIALTVTEVNSAPVLAAIATQVITETETLTFTASATDSDLPAQTLTYGLFSGPVGASVNSSSGLVSWTPTETDTMGLITVIVSDTTGLTDTTTALVTVIEANSAPVLAAIGDQTLAESQLFTLTLTATDSDLPAQTLSYTMTNAPAGAALSGNLFSWTPAASQGPGQYALTFSVSDDGTPVLTASETITLTVTDSDNAPNLSITKAVDPAAASPGQTITYTIVVSNSGGGAENVVISDALPDYLTGADLNQTVAIPAGGQVTFTLAATVAADAPAGMTITNTAAFSHTSGAGQATAAIVITDTQPVIYLSTDQNGTVAGLLFADEDILAFDPGLNSWSKLFDGSDVGLGNTDLVAFSILADGSLLLSLDRSKAIPGLGLVNGSDIVRFVPTSLGENTAGRFEWYFDGSDVGLKGGSENIDTVAFTPDGDLLISTIGPFKVPGVGGRDEDLIRFTPTSLGQNTSGAWTRYFDGSDIGLRRNSEDLRSAWVDPANGDIYLTTKGNFAVEGLSGDGADIFICTPLSLGANTRCTFSFYWDGSSSGLTANIDAFAIGGAAMVAMNKANVAGLDVAEVELADIPEEMELAADDSGDENDSDALHDLDDISPGAANDTTLYLPLIFAAAEPGTASLPDVVINDLSLTPIAGNTYTITLVVRNQGGAIPSGNNFFVNAYLISDLNHPIMVCGVQATALEAGQSVSCSGQYTFNNGADTLRGWADPYNTVAEADENNNIRAAGVVALDNQPVKTASQTIWPEGPLPTPTPAVSPK